MSKSKFIKSLVSGVLTSTLALTMILPSNIGSITSKAAEPTFDDLFTYTKDDGAQEVTITAYKGTPTTVTIPASVGIDTDSNPDTPAVAYAVNLNPTGFLNGKSGGKGYAYNNKLTAVTIEDGVTLTSGDATNMFAAQTQLATVTIDDSVWKQITVADSMFENCTSLTEFESLRNDTVTSATSMFKDCHGLTTVKIDVPALTDATSMFSGCENLATISTAASTLSFGGVTTMDNMFKGCEALTSSANIEKFPEATSAVEAFNGATVFDKMPQMNKATTIEKAFVGTAITEADLSGMSALVDADHAFEDSQLATVTLGSGFSKLTSDEGCYFKNTPLETVNKVTVKSGAALTSMFEGTKITDLDLSGLNGTYSDAKDMFKGVTTLTSITMPNNLIISGNDAELPYEMYSKNSDNTAGDGAGTLNELPRKKTVYKAYTVTWKDQNNAVITEKKIISGTDASAIVDEPCYTDITFATEADLTSVENDMTVYVNQEEATIYYSVTWKNASDNTTVKTVKVETGSDASTYLSDTCYTDYTCTTEADITNVQSDMTVYIKDVKKTFTVTWKNQSGKTVHTAKVEDGNSASTLYTKTAYKDQDCTEIADLSKITADTTVYVKDGESGGDEEGKTKEITDSLEGLASDNVSADANVSTVLSKAVKAGDIEDTEAAADGTLTFTFAEGDYLNDVSTYPSLDTASQDYAGVFAYSISADYNGTEIHTTGPVKIKVPVPSDFNPNKAFTMRHCKNGSTATEKISVSYSASTKTADFTGTSFSDYILFYNGTGSGGGTTPTNVYTAVISTTDDSNGAGLSASYNVSGYELTGTNASTTAATTETVLTSEVVSIGTIEYENAAAVTGLAPGYLYVVRQTTPPDGYARNTTTNYFVITEDGATTTKSYTFGKSIVTAKALSATDAQLYDIKYKNKKLVAPTASITLGVDIDGSDISASKWNGKFKYTISTEDDATKKYLPSPVTVKNSGGSVKFASVTYPYAVADYKYKITQADSGSVEGLTLDEDAEIEVTVHVTQEDGQYKATPEYTSGKTSYTNVYTKDKVTATITADVELNGKDIKTDTEFASAFKFKLSPSGDNRSKNPVEAVEQSNNYDIVSFNDIEFPAEAGEWSFEITQIKPEIENVSIDTGVVKVTVTIGNDSNGELAAKVKYGNKTKFTNTYGNKANDLKKKLEEAVNKAVSDPTPENIAEASKALEAAKEGGVDEETTKKAAETIAGLTPKTAEQTAAEKAGTTVASATENPDGTTTTTLADGTSITKSNDGTTTTILPDGTRVVTDKNGNTVTTSPDGTVTRTTATTDAEAEKGETITTAEYSRTARTTGDYFNLALLWKRIMSIFK